MKNFPHRTTVLSAISIGLMAAVAFADNYPIVIGEGADTRIRWAGAELSTFLGEIYPEDRFPVVDSVPGERDFIVLAGGDDVDFAKARTKRDELGEPGEFSVSHAAIGTRQVGMICGRDSRAVLDGVYALLEQKLGYGFYLYRNASEAADPGSFTFDKWDLSARPLVRERLCFNWYNFISGVTAWNLPDYQHWILQAARMRHTDVMLHTYGWGPFTQFSHNGMTKSVGHLQNTAFGNHWGNMHTADVRKLIGGESLADEGPVFGADVSKIGHGGITEENRVAKSKALLREAIDYAVNTVGMEFNWSFDIDTLDGNPQNIITTLPESARFQVGENWLARPDTEEGFRYFKQIIETTMQDYPALTKITVWWRHKTNTAYGGLSLTIKEDELPAEWRTAYAAAPADARNDFGPGHVYHAQVAGAFRRALDELGHSAVKLGYGSWWMEDSHESLLSANHFMPQDMGCYVLDYHMVFGEQQDYRNQLAKVAADRPLVVIEWAHHDDGGYLGRPYLPPENFATKLEETGASGYGVIHWMTRPLDVFFKNLQNQVWSNTTNEPIELTCKKMAVDFFGESQSATMAEHLHAWVTTAPQFARETGDGLGKPGSVGDYGSVEDFDARVAGCDRRIAILDRVDTSKLTPRALEAWKYFRGHEEWIKLFHLAQKDWDRDLQEKTIRKYVEKTSHDGGMTRGEKGILIQHNLKWLKMPGSKRPVPVPVVTDHFVNIYKPQEDVYTGPTRKVTRGKCTFVYEQGKSYKNWRTNDHTFIKDHNNRWHCFGITKPWMSGDNSHAAEGLCFHAVAPETANGTFAETVEFQSWRDRPKIQEGGVGWAPSAIKIGSQYNLVGSGLDRMVSDDLENWTYAGKLTINLEGVGGQVRDPHISVIDGIYHMVICCGNKVGLSTSKDFVNWTDMVVIFKPENDDWQTESPFLVRYEGRYYLFWTLWDKGDLTTYGYGNRTFVQCSDSLMDFHGEPLVELGVKSPRLIQDTDGSWFISSTDHPHLGISVAPLEWKSGSELGD